jgi:hypothetical protein
MEQHVKGIVLKYGFISGGILAGMMVVQMAFMDQIGFDMGAVVGYTTMVIGGLMIYFGIRSYRDGIGGGVVTFGRAFRVGITIVAISTTCYVATWQVVYYKFMPDFGDKYSAHVLEKAKADGMPAAELEAKRVELEKFKEMYKNPLVNIGFTFLEPLPVGLLMTLIAAGLLRREAKRTDT